MFPIGDDDTNRRTVPLVTYGLIVLNVLVFLVELNGGDSFIEQWSVVPRRLMPILALTSQPSSPPCSCMQVGSTSWGTCCISGFLATTSKTVWDTLSI